VQDLHTAARRRTEPLDPTLVAALARGAALPRASGGTSRVQHVQTHLSHVFLAGDRVYKLRKAVDLGFVCFATRDERNADCLREVRLNRRLSPDVYLGVAPIERAPNGAWRVAALREEIPHGSRAEHVVVMRRLPAGRDARTLLAARRLRPADLDAVADLVAGFHARSRAERPLSIDAAEWLQRVTWPVAANFESLAAALASGGAAAGAFPPVRLAQLRARTEAWLVENASALEARRRDGRSVDGHGDLHLEHVWFERAGAPPLLVDCLEFRDDLREIDAASEVAFLAMDLSYRGARRLGERFLARYAGMADDFDLYRVVDFFIAYRAAVRGKVAAVAAGDAAIPAAQRAAARTSVRKHLTLAARALALPGKGALVLTCGSVGSGKSSVARAVADALGAVVIASDRVRKGPGLAHRPHYDESAKAAVYAALLERARPVLRSGRIALLDATWDLAARRAGALSLAAEEDVPAFLLETRCAPAVARERLAARQRAGSDPSDAGPDLLAASARGFEPPREWPRAARAVVRTDTAWRGRVREIARRWLRRPRRTG
jgi:aminoglycoside phosphotransferase family enzyme/predicted kinase